MTANIYYSDAADPSIIRGKTVAIIGYGSQGHAHARNLKDSGVSVVVGLREGSKSVGRAREAGLEVLSVADAAARGDVVMILAPDQDQKSVYEASVRDNLKDGDMLMFAHGFNIHFGQIVPPEGVDV